MQRLQPEFLIAVLWQKHCAVVWTFAGLQDPLSPVVVKEADSALTVVSEIIELLPAFVDANQGQVHEEGCLSADSINSRMNDVLAIGRKKVREVHSAFDPKYHATPCHCWLHARQAATETPRQ